MKPLTVKLDVTKEISAWAAVAHFSGPVEFEVGSQGITVADALRSLAEAIELYFEHHGERGDDAR